MKQNVDSSKFNHWSAFFKAICESHANKYGVFTKEDISNYLKEAGYKKCLLIKAKTFWMLDIMLFNIFIKKVNID